LVTGNSNLVVVLGDTSIADTSADEDNFAAGFATRDPSQCNLQLTLATGP
jgi:hypothetical protein